MKSLFSIQEVSQNTGVSTSTLRYYENLKILNPKRDQNNRRVYSSEDIEQIKCISKLRALTMPISQIVEYEILKFNGQSSIIKRINILQDYIVFLKELNSKIEKDINTLENRILRYQEEVSSIS